MTYQKALAVLTDWFHEYHDDKGALVRERHITEEYNEAVDVVAKALCKLMGYEDKINKYGTVMTAQGILDVAKNGGVKIDK